MYHKAIFVFICIMSNHMMASTQEDERSRLFDEAIDAQIKGTKICHSTLMRLKELAPHDDSLAMVMAGIYQSGMGEHEEGSHQGLQEEIKWLIIAAASNRADAKFHLSMRFCEPHVLGVNKEKAFHYLSQAKEENVEAASWSLGDDVFESSETTISTTAEENIRFVDSAADLYKLIEQKITSDDWFVSDIDYVLHAPKDWFGRPRGQSLCHKLMRGDPRWNNEKQRHQLAERTMFAMEYELVDSDMPKFLMALKSKNIPTLALTRMSVSMSSMDALDWRVRQMEELGLVFDIQMDTDQELCIGEESNLGAYKRNIIRAGKNQKGDALGYFMDFIKKTKPKKIVFVDNNRQYLESVLRACKKRGVEFLGIHFVSRNFEDDRPDVQIIAKQLEVLASGQKFVSYDEAQHIDMHPLQPTTWLQEDELIFSYFISATTHRANEACSTILEKAKQGNCLAKACAACLYNEGIGGVLKDADLGQRYALESAEYLAKNHNNGIVAYILGHMFKTGIGVGAEKEKAQSLLQSAAQQGNEGAQLALGTDYVHTGAVPAEVLRDLPNAIELLTRMARMGNKKAAEDLRKLLDFTTSGSKTLDS